MKLGTGFQDSGAHQDTELQPHAQVKPRLKRRKNISEADQNAITSLILLDVDNLRPHFHLPLGQAAKQIGVCKTALKKACRKIGILGWPFRKLRAVERKLAQFYSKQSETLRTSQTDAQEPRPYVEAVEKLLQLKSQLMEGKEIGKGIAKELGCDDMSDLDMNADISDDADTTFSQHSCFREFGECTAQSQSACISSCNVEDAQKSIEPLNSYCTYPNIKPSDYSNGVLNDILKSGDNPFASEFLNLSDGVSAVISSTFHGGGQSTSIGSSMFSDMSDGFQSKHQAFSCGECGHEDAGWQWTSRDELRSMQSLVGVLIKEQQELVNELKRSQHAVQVETHKAQLLEQTVADLRRQLEGHAC